MDANIDQVRTPRAPRLGFIISYFSLGLGLPQNAIYSLYDHLPDDYCAKILASELRKSDVVRSLCIQPSGPYQISIESSALVPYSILTISFGGRIYAHLCTDTYPIERDKCRVSYVWRFQNRVEYVRRDAWYTVAQRFKQVVLLFNKVSVLLQSLFGTPIQTTGGGSTGSLQWKNIDITCVPESYLRVTFNEGYWFTATLAEHRGKYYFKYYRKWWINQLDDCYTDNTFECDESTWLKCLIEDAKIHNTHEHSKRDSSPKRH